MKHPNKEVMRELIKYTKRNNKGENDSSGCFVVKGDKIIAKGISRVGINRDASAHGEVNAIKKACKKLNNAHLKDCWIYSTQIPCPMCTTLVAWTEAKGIVWGWDGRHTWGQLNIKPEIILKKAKKKVKVVSNFLEDECLTIKGYTKAK